MTRISSGMAMAAGLGTRMRPLTNDRPKALVEVGGKTLLDWMLDRYAAAGVEKAVVNIHHFADRMEAHLAARSGAPEIEISDERDELLETGGGLAKARPRLGQGPVFVSNIDAVWIDGAVSELQRLMEAWDEDRMSALLLLAPMEQTLGFDGAGDFFLEADGRLRRRGEASAAPYAYAGAQILDLAAMDGEPVEKFSLNRVWNRLLAQGRVYGLPMRAFWMHVGDPGARDEAEARLGEAA